MIWLDADPILLVMRKSLYWLINLSSVGNLGSLIVISGVGEWWSEWNGRILGTLSMYVWKHMWSGKTSAAIILLIYLLQGLVGQSSSNRSRFPGINGQLQTDTSQLDKSLELPFIGYLAACLHYRPPLPYDCPIRQRVGLGRRSWQNPEYPLAYALHSAPLRHKTPYFYGNKKILPSISVILRRKGKH